MMALIDRLFASDKIRYLFAGGCTTLVNLISFFLLRSFTQLGRNICNVIAIALAIAFAYAINKLFVFRSKTSNWYEALSEMVSFVGARIIAMGVEVLGFAVLCDSFRINELFAKLIVQFVVLVVNYIFSNLFVFNRQRRSLSDKLRDNYCYYISFIVVLIFMTAICVAQEIIPFGTNSLTIVDSVHQYLPFMAEQKYKLVNEGSLFYTWNIAMGSNFVSLSAYYLNSPFNYLLLLFNKNNLILGINIIIVLKVCLSALSMAYYLSNKGRKKSGDIYIIALSVAYALSNYVIGYCWNMMWMDCILMLPLLMLGFVQLMRDKNPRLYTLALFYCLYCNYYIGFMICVFLVLWFFVYSHPGIKAFFMDGIRFAIFSLLGGGMAMFTLIPAYFGIMSTASGNMVLPKWEWYGSIIDILKQQMFLTKTITNQTFDGGANLYCGMLAVFTFFLYITGCGDKPFEKIRKVLVIALLLASCNNKLLNYIWHGFHDQYGIPNRFTFLIVFLLLDIAFDVLGDIRNIKPFNIVFGGILASLYIGLCGSKAAVGNTILICSLIMLVIYVVWCGFRARGTVKKFVFSFVLTLICCVELIVNGTFGFLENGIAKIPDKYDTTPQIAAANEEIKTMAQKENAGFYRAELMDSTVLDEATWHQLPSVGTFCSTVLGDMVSAMGKLGFYTGANEFLYMGYTPFTNSIFNVRYLLYRDGNYNNYDYNYVKTVDGIGIYENPYPLSLGFCVNDDIIDWNLKLYKYENAQNNLATIMTGEGDIFKNVKNPLMVETDDGKLFVTGSRIKFTPDKGGGASFTASFYAEAEGDYYLNCRGSYLTKLRFCVNGEELTYDRYQGQMFHLGSLNAGDYVNIEFEYRSVEEGKEYTVNITSSLFDREAYEGVYEKLRENMLSIEQYGDGYVKGKVYAPDNQVLFTSIPYDEGWTVRVDGNITEYKKVCDAFIAIPLEEGTHTIEMSYMPKGLMPGMGISIMSFLIFGVCIMLGKKKKNSVDMEENTHTEQENSNNDIDRKVNI